MKMRGVLLLFLACALAAWAAPIKSYTSVLGGPILANFEAYADGTPIDTQYPGVTFGQAPVAGRPMIDQYPWLFGYGASSGDHVLTGSQEGGYSFPTVAGITVAFASPVRAAEIFLSDTAPLGNYEIQAFGAGHVLLESLTVLQTETLPPGYAGGVFPPPGTSPLPGIYVGFMRGSADIASLQIGPSTAFPSDAFAVDDLRVGAVPEPSTVALLCTGIAGLALLRRKRG